MTKSNEKIEKLIIDNVPTSDPSVIANTFNDFFVKVGVEISESILPTNATAASFMPILNNIEELNLGTTDATHFCDIVKSLQPKNSTDSDGLSSKLFKKIAIEISRPMSHIFNLSLTNGIFPAKLKKSRTVPVFKTGDPFSCDNYRPIALLSTLSKVLEKMVSVKLVNHLDFNNILYKHQYGFQKNKSTEHNLIQAVNFISNALNDNKFCMGVFFDLKKAFDVCSHDILLMKLEKMGIKGVALQWFKSYLSNRTQFVDINGTHSFERAILISILQGSILGPILFLCYINDLYLVTDFFTLMFADDTGCFKSDTNLENLTLKVNQEINKMAIWFRANKLAVNKSKTKYIVFRSRNKRLPEVLPDVIYNENEIGCPFNPDLCTILERFHSKHENTSSRAYKLLGVYLDEHLSFDYHIDFICKKLSKSLYCINLAKTNVNFHGMRSLYFALIHSHLSYCSVLFNCATKNNINRLFKIQKKAIRIITKSPYNAHTNELFYLSGILPFEKIIKQSQLLFMHAIFNSYAPSSFDNTWSTLNQLQPNLNLRNANDFILPNPRTEQFKKSPLYSLPLAWNTAGDITSHTNRTTFKLALKNMLLDELITNT